MASILVVDDDAVILKVVSAALAKAGHSVATAQDGFTAIDRLQREIFDLLITDINMPSGLSGYSLVTTVRKDERSKNMPIMFITGRRDKQDVERAIRSGVDDYMVKPIDQDILLAKVESLLQSKRGPHSFQQTPANVSATWTQKLTIIGLSEQGLSFTAPYAIPLNAKIRLESDLFDTLGFPSPQLRVGTCQPVDAAQSSFTVFASFIGLSESELQSIRRWVMSHSKSSKAS